MAATFPGGVKVFTTKQAGDQIASAHINDLQDEVVAVETELRKTTGSVVSHGSLAGLSNNDHPQYLLAATGKAADSDKLDGLDSTAFVEVSDPIGFWIPPAAFANVTWITFGNNRIHNFVDASVTAIDSFISIPVAGKRLELTALMTSNATGDIDTAIELRYLQEGKSQDDAPTMGDTMLFTINPIYAVRKKTITLDVSDYSAGATFALRMRRIGGSDADTCSGHGYFFGISGRWID